MLLILADISYLIVIVLHVYFVVLEMALWRKKAPKVFRITPEFAEQTARLASNQGLYNGFLAIALLIGFFSSDVPVATAFTIYGLSCVIIAGIWGRVTISRRIFYVQGTPAIIALIIQFLPIY